MLVVVAVEEIIIQELAAQQGQVVEVLVQVVLQGRVVLMVVVEQPIQ